MILKSVYLEVVGEAHWESTDNEAGVVEEQSEQFVIIDFIFYVISIIVVRKNWLWKKKNLSILREMTPSMSRAAVFVIPWQYYGW